MGLFDYVVFTCPKCGKLAEDQTKDGPCIMGSYNLDLPLTLGEAYVINEIRIVCNHCGKDFIVTGDLPGYKIHMQIEEIK